MALGIATSIQGRGSVEFHTILKIVIFCLNGSKFHLIWIQNGGRLKFQNSGILQLPFQLLVF